jgi:hypothetical protein
MEPKVAFFESLLGSKQAILLLLHQPTLLTTSLTKRLIPRSDRMTEVGMQFKDMSVTYMCIKTDVLFDEYLMKHVLKNG